MSKYKEKPWLIDDLVDNLDYYLACAGTYLKALRKALKELQETSE